MRLLAEGSTSGGAQDTPLRRALLLQQVALPGSAGAANPRRAPTGAPPAAATGRPSCWELDSATAAVYASAADLPPGDVLPVYAQRAPVTPRDWAKLVAKGLARADADLPPGFDPLPDDQRAQHAFVPWLQARRPLGLALSRRCLVAPASVRMPGRAGQTYVGGTARRVMRHCLLLTLTLTLLRGIASVAEALPPRSGSRGHCAS